MNLPMLKKVKEHNFFFDIKNSTKFLLPKCQVVPEIEKEVIYRSNRKTIDKIVEYDSVSGEKIRVTNFDYFNDKKVKSIDEFSAGIKIRTTSFALFKSVTEYDKKTGKKLKTTNFQPKDENKISSVYDYDIETERIIKMSVYRSDGNSIAFVKEMSPTSGLVTRCINYKKNSSAIASVSKYDMLGDNLVKTTYYYSTPIFLSSGDLIDKKLTADSLNMRVLNNFKDKKFDKLIDSLYKNRENLSVIHI